MPVYRCDWCGRFYSSPLPENTSCPNHIPEHNERLQASIARHNQKLELPRVRVQGFDRLFQKLENILETK